MPNIGDIVYIFDINHREYHRDENRRAIGGPIYREHFRPFVIVREEKRSWVVTAPGSNYENKVSKSKVMTSKDVDDACWMKDNRCFICDLINRLDDATTLRKIADLIGYKDKTDGH